MMIPKDLRAKEVENKDDGYQIRRLPDDLFYHVNSEEWICLLVRLAVEQGLAGLVRRERERGKSVHYEVDPKELHCTEGRLLRCCCDSSDERDDDGGNVGVDLELKEFSHSIVYATAPHDSMHDRREIVIHQDDVGCLLGHLGPCDAHRESNVSCLESRAIVRAVSGDANNIATVLERLNQQSLIVRRGSSKDLQSRRNSFHDFRREHAEMGSFHNNTPGSVDVTLLRDRPSSEHIVSCTHCHADASAFALGYGLSDTFSERVFDSSNAN